MSFSHDAWSVFELSIRNYHELDDVNAPEQNPFPEGSLERLLYAKNWIDTVQWHLEDIIRDEHIDPSEALLLKRRIDKSNQLRTDLVEYIDSYFFKKFKEVTPKSNARLSTETPAWAVDRLSILALKIFHMDQEAHRESATAEHREKCGQKLSVLLAQKSDLSTAIDQLLADMENGSVKAGVYKQMKMYNDQSLNPILYRKDT